MPQNAFSIENQINIEKKYTRHPYNWEWTRPVDKDGIVHKAKKG